MSSNIADNNQVILQCFVKMGFYLHSSSSCRKPHWTSDSKASTFFCRTKTGANTIQYFIKHCRMTYLLHPQRKRLKRTRKHLRKRKLTWYLTERRVKLSQTYNWAKYHETGEVAKKKNKERKRKKEKERKKVRKKENECATIETGDRGEELK